MSALQLQRHNYRDFRTGGRRVLFHTPSSALFELNATTGAVLDLFEERGSVVAEDVKARFDGVYPAPHVVEALGDLLELGVVAARERRFAVTGKAPESLPLSTLVLNVTTGCNLGCRYCYRSDVTVPGEAKRMDEDTARAAVDLLLAEAPGQSPVSIVFFGGEPLANLPLIREVVSYAEARCADRRVDFSLTTNATLLTEEVVDFFDAHRFGISVSMDGPQATHDRNRLTIRGTGTYATVSDRVRMLLQRYRSKPVGARVTLSAGSTDVVAIHRHLRDELGFAEVGFAPVTAAEDDKLALSVPELARVFEGMKALGEQYVQAALEGRPIGFSNMQHLMLDLRRGTRKALPCGAGLGMLAVGTGGLLHLCHRFTGTAMPSFGDVNTGVDKRAIAGFLDKALVQQGSVCADCSARSLCAGGCYHESFVRYGDPLAPTHHYCDLLRDWIDFGIEAYIRIQERNPEFFERVSTHS